MKIDVTVGHFAFKASENSLLSSRRKMNYNRLADRDLVEVTLTKQGVTAHGWKPSAGTRSQFEVLSCHPILDCIVHFHCPLKSGSQVPVRSQREFECGSHECGRNTMAGLKMFGKLGAVMLDQHGPNIAFSSHGDSQEVIQFIDENFDLSGRTDQVSSM